MSTNTNESNTHPQTKYLVVSATDRPGSRTLVLARQICSLLRELASSHGGDVGLLDLSALPQGWFSPSAYEDRKNPDRPEVADWLSADGLLVVVPEYNGSFPGVIKHYIDLLPFPAATSQKAVAFVGLAAGSWGGINAVNHLQTIFVNRKALLFPSPVLIPGANNEISENGIRSPYSDRIAEQAVGFIDFVRKVCSVDN